MMTKEQLEAIRGRARGYVPSTAARLQCAVDRMALLDEVDRLTAVVAQLDLEGDVLELENEGLREDHAADNLAFDVIQTKVELLRLTLGRLLDRNITYFDNEARLPFESHDQAIKHIAEARSRAALERP